MFYVNVMNFCKGNINAYINFDTIYLATLDRVIPIDKAYISKFK